MIVSTLIPHPHPVPLYLLQNGPSAGLQSDTARLYVDLRQANRTAIAQESPLRSRLWEPARQSWQIRNPINLSARMPYLDRVPSLRAVVQILNTWTLILHIFQEMILHPMSSIRNRGQSCCNKIRTGVFELSECKTRLSGLNPFVTQ